MEKRIKNYEDYAITDTGEVISYKYNTPRVMKTWYQKSGYENVKLCKNNKTEHFLIHRLVAEAFIPNPHNYLEVNHKDHNPKNNNVTNLEWVDRKQNVKDSYLGFVRNHLYCKLVKISTGEIIGEFVSIKDACRYAEQNLNISLTYLQKKKQVGDYKIVIESVETKIDNN